MANKEKKPVHGETRTVKIGVVGVDSGQLMLCDPCYIESEWRRDDTFQDIRRYQNKEGRVIQYRVEFEHFQCKIKPYDKTVNELIADGTFKEIPNPVNRNFSYGGACSVTLQPTEEKFKDGANQLNFKLGHAGAGVAFNTGLGDGCYDVYAEYVYYKTWGWRCMKVWVEFITID